MNKFKLVKSNYPGSKMSKKNIKSITKQYINGKNRKQFFTTPTRMYRLLRAICNKGNYSFNNFVKDNLTIKSATRNNFRKSFHNYNKKQWKQIIDGLFGQVLKISPDKHLKTMHEREIKYQKHQKYLKKTRKKRREKREKLDTKKLKTIKSSLLNNCKKEAIDELKLIKQ